MCAPAARHNAGARRGAGRQRADASTRRAPAGAGQEPVSRRGQDRSGSRMSGPPHLDSRRRAEPGEQPRYPPKESETSAASGPVCTSSETSAGRRPSRDVGPLPGRVPAGSSQGTLACARPGAPRGRWLAFGKQTEPSAVREMPAKPLTDAAPSPPGPRGHSGGVAVTRSRGLRPEGRGRRPGCQLREGAGPPSQHAGPAPGALNLLHPTRLLTSGQASPNTLAFWVTSV